MHDRSQTPIMHVVASAPALDSTMHPQRLTSEHRGPKSRKSMTLHNDERCTCRGPLLGAKQYSQAQVYRGIAVRAPRRMRYMWNAGSPFLRG